MSLREIVMSWIITFVGRSNCSGITTFRRSGEMIEERGKRRTVAQRLGGDSFRDVGKTEQNKTRSRCP